jgi:hypothetical protein
MVGRVAVPIAVQQVIDRGCARPAARRAHVLTIVTATVAVLASPPRART